VLQKLHNEELAAPYSLPNIIQVIKSTIRWPGYLAQLGVEMYWWRNLRENPGVDGRMILRWIYRTWDWGVWTALIWLKIGTGDGLL